VIDWPGIGSIPPALNRDGLTSLYIYAGIYPQPSHSFSCASNSSVLGCLSLASSSNSSASARKQLALHSKTFTLVDSIREFGTQLRDLLALRRWLEEHKCHHVAMESTGVYWQPVYAVLETALSDEMHLLVVNARHMKNVPGKKTDMRDAEWIATLLRAGLLKGSFVPERDIRDLRQFTRYRKALIRDITSQKNRIEKLLQSQGFLLSSILSDSFGRSGLAIMHQLVQDGFMTEQSLDRCLKAQVRKKAHEILSSLNGTLSMPQRKLLKMQLAHLADLQANLREVEEEIHDGFSQFQGPIELLDSIPGIDQTAAYTILAEIGAEMSAFPTAQHICSWAGLAPGNYKSANKQKKQRLTPGNNYLKTMLCEVAWVIASHKKLYLSSWYWRLKQQTDAKRAIVALARKLLVIIYTMLKTDQLYNEQKFLDRKQASERRKVNRMVYELSRLGYAVSLPA
jgi:transposase